MTGGQSPQQQHPVSNLGQPRKGSELICQVNHGRNQKESSLSKGILITMGKHRRRKESQEIEVRMHVVVVDNVMVLKLVF